MRQIILDTETTGLEVAHGHRIIEIGCVELVARRPTGRVFHHYLNPEREIDEAAMAVHGLTLARLAREPRFAEIASDLLEFVDDAEVVIHNAPFDMAFIGAELERLGEGSRDRLARWSVFDTLVLARQMHPGQRNSLDALCKRYGIDASHRELHGALLDARILADVYLAMTGGQSALALAESAPRPGEGAAKKTTWSRDKHGKGPFVVSASAGEVKSHEAMLERIARASGGAVLFR